MNNELIYVDTDCYIDHFEGRVDKLRPLGEFAYNLIRKSILCEYRIIISNIVIDELEFNGYGHKTSELISDLKEAEKLVFIEETSQDDEKARKIKRERTTPLNDTKHAVLSARSGAVFFVTRNMKDFEKLQDLVKLKYPENL